MKILFKNLISIALLILTPFSYVFSQISIEGVWEGILEVAPGTEITVHFDVTQRSDGGFSAVLNSPDNGAIKDISATSANFDGSQLDISVESLAGSYSGQLSDGMIRGTWSQPGAEIVMELRPYVAKVLSQEAIDLLLGQWNGKLIIPGGEFTILFHFEENEEGEFIGAIQNVDAGDQKPVMSDISVENGVLFFRVPQAQAEYSGQINGTTITGNLTQGGQELPLNVEKGEYVAVLPELSLTDADLERLQGTWTGKVGALTAVVNFDRNDEGIIFGEVSIPEQGASGLQISAAQVTEGRLHFTVSLVNGQFRGEIEGETIEGTWTQAGMTNPITLTKGEYVPEVATLALNDQDMEILEGSWSGTLGPLTLVFNFNRDESGVIVVTVDSPDQGAAGLPVTAAQVSEGRLELELAALGASYSGVINENAIEGAWTQAGMSNPLSMTKQ